MEGAISLGIYDHTGKLVRILHRAATADEFVAALDGYITHWDGLDDTGKPLPPGRYSARGYLVGALNVRAIPMPTPPASAKSAASPTLAASSASPSASSSPVPAGCGTVEPGQPPPGLSFPNGKPFVAQHKIQVVLTPNPLDRDRAGSAELSIGLDVNGVAWLQLADGLPLKQISVTSHLDEAFIGRSGPGEPLFVVLLNYTVGVEAYTITKVSNMMSFDCGDFDLPPPAK